ncbi:hypothetical protein TRICI_000583 [Trichomonascus ciferrii]|uniref:Uncharacterized protein n=1 Tax=Trichomonascus ciferrii TaxID=44093 RepID=A0A642VD38_9ASCO|nr:hypothetical protein TRICI_000583 [Trichomonascus ciferrii]
MSLGRAWPRSSPECENKGEAGDCTMFRDGMEKTRAFEACMVTSVRSVKTAPGRIFQHGCENRLLCSFSNRATNGRGNGETLLHLVPRLAFIAGHPTRPRESSQHPHLQQTYSQQQSSTVGQTPVQVENGRSRIEQLPIVLAPPTVKLNRACSFPPD